MQDYYKILGVDRNADGDAIAKAYKALAKRLHPDINADAGSAADVRAPPRDEQLREVIKAYKALSKPSDRAAYDEVWGNRRAVLRRRILFIAVLAMAGSVTLVSLSAAYLWRAEFLAVQDMLRRPTGTNAQIAGKSPAEAVVAPPPRLAERTPDDAPLPEASKPRAPHVPHPVAATSPAAREVETITGPLRVARSVPALLASRASEVTKFAKVAIAEADQGPEIATAFGTQINSGPVEAGDVGSTGANSVPVPTPRLLLRAPSTATVSGSDPALPLPLPVRPPPQAETAQPPEFTRQQALALVSERYLTGGSRNRRRLLGLYCSRVDYWGERAASRTSVVNQIADFASRWPYRTYKLQPGSFEFVSVGHPLRYKVEFTYEFTVASGHGYGGAAGVASGRLMIKRQNGRWRICSEEGRVLQRASSSSGISGGTSSKYAGGQRMDSHRILFGE